MMLMKMCVLLSRWLRSPVLYSFQRRFARRGMRNIRQRPPGCYECVAIISCKELSTTCPFALRIWYCRRRTHHWVVRSNCCKEKRPTQASCPRRADSSTRLSKSACCRWSQAEASTHCLLTLMTIFRIVELIASTDLVPWPACRNPQVELNSSNLFWRAASESMGEGNQEEEKKLLSSLSSFFSWLLNQSPSLSTCPNIIVVRDQHSTQVCGGVADAIFFSFVQTSVVLWRTPFAFWFGDCTLKFSCTFLVLTKVKVRLDSLLNK